MARSVKIIRSYPALVILQKKLVNNEYIASIVVEKQSTPTPVTGVLRFWRIQIPI
jgi:hypothetical protein